MTDPARETPSFYPLNSHHIFKNPLAFFPIYTKITNQIKIVEPQAVFFSMKVEAILARQPRLSARDGGQAVIRGKKGLKLKMRSLCGWRFIIIPPSSLPNQNME